MFPSRRKAATFRKDSSCRNLKAEVTKQGWLYKQASSGVKQWNRRWFVLSDRCLFYYKDQREDSVLGSLPLLGFQIGRVQPADKITRRYAFKVKHPDSRTFFFSSENLTDLDDWIEKLRTASQDSAPCRTDQSEKPVGGQPPPEEPCGGVKAQPDPPVVLRRGPRTLPERTAERRSSMAHLQQWVNQRRGVASQEDLSRLSRGGSPLRPDSVCSMSPSYWGAPRGVDTWMRRLSMQPRSRSVPRSEGGLYSPGRPPGRLEDVYADSPGLRRSISSPKYIYPGERRSYSPGIYHHSYHPEDMLDFQLQRNLDYLDQQVPFFHEVYSRSLHPTLKLNEIETSKLLGRLCEQSQTLKEQQAAVYRLRMTKDRLEEDLMVTHQEMEVYQNQLVVLEKLQFKKESQQSQLIHIRGELSYASKALNAVQMEFEALEDEAFAIHGDLWEQLNAGGQSELVRRHVQKEFWRVQDVLEGLHKDRQTPRPADPAPRRAGGSASFTNGSVSALFPPETRSTHPPLDLQETVPPRPPLPTSYSPWEPVNSATWLQAMDHREDLKNGDQRNQNAEDQNQSSKVGVVPPRTKSPGEDFSKSFVFPAEVKSRMSLEEQNQRIRRNQRRSLNLGQTPANYKVVRRRMTAHEIDIKDLEAAVRGENHESPGEEIARLRRLQNEPERSALNHQVAGPGGSVVLERFLDPPLSPEEQKEKKKKLDRIKTLITKSNLQNLVPVLDGPEDLQQQEKRIEMSCALAAEASRRSRLLSGQSQARDPKPDGSDPIPAQCGSPAPTSSTSPAPTSPTSPAPTHPNIR